MKPYCCCGVILRRSWKSNRTALDEPEVWFSATTTLITFFLLLQSLIISWMRWALYNGGRRRKSESPRSGGEFAEVAEVNSQKSAKNPTQATFFVGYSLSAPLCTTPPHCPHNTTDRAPSVAILRPAKLYTFLLFEYHFAFCNYNFMGRSKLIGRALRREQSRDWPKVC